MKLSKAQKLYIRHVRRDYSSWSIEELKQEYNRIGQELLLRERPDSEEQHPGYPFASEMPNIEYAVDRFFDRRGVPIQHAIWREDRNLR